MAGPQIDPALYRPRDVVPVRRALVSVSDKTDLLRLAEALAAAGVEIVSTGSTAARIREAGFEVTDVASVTGFPESLDGRVKTLHPSVHAGLLAYDLWTIRQGYAPGWYASLRWQLTTAVVVLLGLALAAG